MDFTDRERISLYRALKILENGEGLLGIDIDTDVVEGLILKVQGTLSEKTVSNINEEIETLIHEAEMALDNFSESASDYESYDDFGPSYPTQETIKVLNKAINEGECVEIDYYSMSQGKFTNRKISPENIERKHGRAYLNAFCHLRNSERVFRIDRIKRIKECN
jgi:predicted DNA-binding transcriptional regulator YafY